MQKFTHIPKIINTYSYYYYYHESESMMPAKMAKCIFKNNTKKTKNYGKTNKKICHSVFCHFVRLLRVQRPGHWKKIHLFISYPKDRDMKT